MGLEAIIEWKMNDLEAKVYKLCLFWERVIRKELPDYYYAKIPRKSDPRKSFLFKCCYKLYNTTKEKIKPEDYKLYILAQIVTLKAIKDVSSGMHALIDPSCLFGEAAWKRWERWRRIHNLMCNNYDFKSKNNNNDNYILTIELKKSKEWLVAKLGENYTKEDIGKCIEDGKMQEWLDFFKVSTYYVKFSLWIDDKQRETLEEDWSLYELSEELIHNFRETFSNEE